jgi:NAD(P)-dependent dehydrogenase (short-subunit alcohol dehydrogenase family)
VKHALFQRFAARVARDARVGLARASLWSDAMTNQAFQGKVALVTGAASGIGRATAIAFAREGARVVVADRDARGGDETVATIRHADGHALFVEVDVASAASVAALFARIGDVYGGLDVAFNNAGIEGSVGATVAECEEAEWDRVLGVNLKGAWLCMKHEIARMKGRAGASIVNCASIAGLVAFPGAGAYVASKHGMVGLTKTAAMELATAGIRVNAVCPGVIATPMIDRATHGQADQLALYARLEPIGRLGRPEEIAEAVLWLCSPGASFVTGAALPVDGGWVAQ